MPVRLSAQVLAVLRPEPGNAATVARAHAAGYTTVALPLFAVEPVAWTVPDPAVHDALILTSANALRFGGAGLAALRGLPVLAVGAHTADAARAAGFHVAAVGDGNAADIVALAEARSVVRALHVTGRERTLSAGGPITTVVPVYASVALDLAAPDLAPLAGAVALLHSARAARRLQVLLESASLSRAQIALAAFSPAIAAAAGTGWAWIETADRPDDAALFAAIGRACAAAKR